MSHTNLQLLRLLIGDSGIAARDSTSGDGAATVFYLASPPIVGDSQVITVAATTYTEVAATPGANQYTLDDKTGKVTFGVAPGIGTDNIVASYLAAEATDADLTAALEAYSLTASAIADTGPSDALLDAASLAATFMAARAASAPASISVDGQTITRRTPAEWSALAQQLQTGGGTGVGTLNSTPLVRIDGYNDTDATTRDIAATTVNPRRRYYGEEDRIP